MFVSTPAFHSSLDWPLPRSASIQGIREPASGTPNCVASMPVRWCARTLRSISRIADAGSSSSELTSALRVPNWFSSSRMWRAPPPEAAWYVMDVPHSTRSFLNSPPRPISMQDTVQLPPMKSFTPPERPASMTSRLMGSSTMMESSFMRSVEAASIQRPSQPRLRSSPWTCLV